MRNQAKKGATYFADDYARNLIRGIPDHKIPVTERGREQGLQTGIALNELYGPPDYVYHSGYTRTIQTKDDLLAAFTPEDRARIQVRENSFVRERDAGYTYDMTQAEAEAAFPWLHEHWQTFGGYIARPPGGESLADVTIRSHLFLEMLYERRAGQNVWVVLHGGTLRCMRFLLEHWTYDQALAWPAGQSPANCGVTDYRYNPDAGRLELSEYNKVYWT